jgi:hypothetical protein
LISGEAGTEEADVHTPRPWWIEKGWFGRKRVCAESALSSSALVASSIYYDDDARLIAAAPELRGALAAMVAEASAKGYDLQSLADAQAALAKT